MLRVQSGRKRWRPHVGSAGPQKLPGTTQTEPRMYLNSSILPRRQGPPHRNPFSPEPHKQPEQTPGAGRLGPVGLWASAGPPWPPLPRPPPQLHQGSHLPPRPSPAPRSSAASASRPPGPSSSPHPARQQPPAATSSRGPRPCPPPLRGQDGLEGHGSQPPPHPWGRPPWRPRNASGRHGNLPASGPGPLPGGQRPPPLRARQPGGESKSPQGWGKGGPQSRNWWNQV